MDREQVEINDLTLRMSVSKFDMESVRVVDLPSDYQLVWTYPVENAVEQMRVHFMRMKDRDNWLETIKKLRIAE